MTRAVLSIECSSIGVGRVLARVLTPDNAGAPKGLSLSMKAQEKSVIFDIASESPSSVLSTVMAILQDVSLFEQVWLLSRAQGA